MRKLQLVKPQVNVNHNGSGVTRSHCALAGPSFSRQRGENNTYVDPNQLWSGVFNGLINNKINKQNQYGRPATPSKDSAH